MSRSVAGSATRAGGRSSTSRHSAIIWPRFSTVNSISVSLSRAGAFDQERLTTNSPAAGRRRPSSSANNRTSPSQAGIAKASRQSQKPGTSQTKPASSSPIDRAVSPKPQRRRRSQAALTGPGWSEGRIIAAVPARRPSRQPAHDQRQSLPAQPRAST